jgi:hypothetical protein
MALVAGLAGFRPCGNVVAIAVSGRQLLAGDRVVFWAA